MALMVAAATAGGGAELGLGWLRLFQGCCEVEGDESFLGWPVRPC